MSASRFREIDREVGRLTWSSRTVSTTSLRANMCDVCRTCGADYEKES